MSLPAIEMTGRRYGRLLVLSRDGSKGGQATWSCKCDCGEVLTVMGGNLRNGTTQSCGCLHRDRTSEPARIQMTTHGLAYTLAYESWSKARSRCHNPDDPAYQYYGARGISMCDRWRNSVEAFVEDMGERKKGESIERIDNDGNYEPGNCCWIPRKEQRFNRRENPVGKSGYRRVHKDGKRWRVVIPTDAGLRRVGSFGSVETAVLARDLAYISEGLS